MRYSGIDSRPASNTPAGLVASPAALACSLGPSIGFGVVAPAIPVFAREFGVGRTAAGAVVSAFAFMRLVSALSSGRLVDRFGERVILATGIGIVAVSSALAGLSQSYLQLLLLRGVGGVGSAMFTVSAMSLLLRVVGSDQRGRAVGLWQAGFLLGGIAGPVFGGVLTSVSTRAPFFVYAVTLAGAGSIGMLFLTHSQLHDKTTDPLTPVSRTTLPRALRISGYRAALVNNFGNGWALFGVRSSLVPLFVVEGLDESATWTGIGFLASAAVQGVLLLPAGRFADGRGRRPAMLIGGAAATTAMLLVALSGSLALYLLAMAIFGAGSAFLSVAPSAIVGDVVSGRGGTVVAAFQMSSDLGAVIGPLLAGWLADAYSFGAAFGATAAVMAVGLVTSLLSRETRHRPEPEQPVVPAPAT